MIKYILENISYSLGARLNIKSNKKNKSNYIIYFPVLYSNILI